MLGGAMRQVGIFAAAGLYALDQGNDQLIQDHVNARRLAEPLARCRGIELDLATVQTNIIVFRLAPAASDAATVVRRAREQGVLVNAFGPRTIRAVTHLDVSSEQCVRAGEVFVSICKAAN
jgi:threonine aldolase